MPCAFGMHVMNLILLNDPLSLCIPVLQGLAQAASPPRALIITEEITAHSEHM